MVGAVLVLVSLFLEWFAPGADAWTVFEVLDLLLAALAIGALLAALGLLLPELAVLERRWMAPLGLGALVIVVSQLIDPPPAVVEGELEEGAWLALAGTLLLVAGALLSFSRVRFAVTVEGRDPRRRQAAVVRDAPDAGPAAPTGPAAPSGPAAPAPGPAAPPARPGGGAQAPPPASPPPPSAPPRDG